MDDRLARDLVVYQLAEDRLVMEQLAVDQLTEELATDQFAEQLAVDQLTEELATDSLAEQLAVDQLMEERPTTDMPNMTESKEDQDQPVTYRSMTILLEASGAQQSS